MKNSYKRGFTLIELLVVIAIIGLLAAVVLASLGSARAKGADAAVKAQLSAIRTSMELYSSNNPSLGYSGGCTSSGVTAALNNANTSAGKGGAVAAATVTSVAGTQSTFSNVVCHDTTNGWAVDAPLNASASGSIVKWCVDSTGAATSTTGTLTTSVGNVTC